MERHLLYLCFNVRPGKTQLGSLSLVVAPKSLGKMGVATGGAPTIPGLSSQRRLSGKKLSARCYPSSGEQPAISWANNKTLDAALGLYLGHLCDTFQICGWPDTVISNRNMSLTITKKVTLSTIILLNCLARSIQLTGALGVPHGQSCKSHGYDGDIHVKILEIWG